MQQGYKPDGWLGMILGAKLFYDFSGKYSFESRVSQLLKAVHEAAGTGDGDATDGEAKKQKATFHAAPEAAAVVWQQVVCLFVSIRPRRWPLACGCQDSPLASDSHSSRWLPTGDFHHCHWFPQGYWLLTFITAAGSLRGTGL